MTQGIDLQQLPRRLGHPEAASDLAAPRVLGEIKRILNPARATRRDNPIGAVGVSLLGKHHPRPQKARRKAIMAPVSKCHYDNGRLLTGGLQRAAWQRRTSLPGLSPPPGTWCRAGFLW